MRIRRLQLLALAALVAVACRKDDSAWIIVPGVRLGPFSAQGSEADLRDRFGAEVQTRPISLGEGEIVTGTVLFPNDTLRRIEITWRDTIRRRELKTAQIEGKASVWRLDNNRVGLGADLVALERTNGRPFKLAGFGWDRSGVVVSWNDGTLQPTMKGVYLFFVPAPEHANSDSYRRVMGDREFPSNDADMRALEPRVGRMVVAFDPAGRVR